MLTITIKSKQNNLCRTLRQRNRTRKFHAIHIDLTPQQRTAIIKVLRLPDRRLQNQIVHIAYAGTVKLGILGADGEAVEVVAARGLDFEREGAGEGGDEI